MPTTVPTAPRATFIFGSFCPRAPRIESSVLDTRAYCAYAPVCKASLTFRIWSSDGLVREATRPAQQTRPCPLVHPADGQHDRRGVDPEDRLRKHSRAESRHCRRSHGADSSLAPDLF